ncbi:MAG TPA: pyridoxal kinase [Gemmatimonadales bacterium]
MTGVIGAGRADAVATPLVISIQSQVVHGHVGNSAAVLPLQGHGVTVAAVPTTLLSNHPHYPTMRGRILDADLVADLLRGVEERGLVDVASAIVTGYVGSVENGRVVADFVERAKARNPRLTYVCDPVIGDADVGVFVAPGIEQLMRGGLVPRADVIAPNHFELGLIVGRELRTPAEVVEAARAACARTIVTGCALDDTPEGMVDTLAVGAHGAWRVRTPRIPVRPAGTGDLFAGLVVAGLVEGKPLHEAVGGAVSSTYSVLERTAAAGTYEMCLAPCVEALTRPGRVFEAVEMAEGRTHG